MLFIDEAECFLQSRDAGGRMGEEVRSALNALLHQTSSQSTKFMMILATNRPEDLDAAMLDRIDDALEFPLPAFEQREELREYMTEMTEAEVHAHLPWSSVLKHAYPFHA